MVLKRFAKSIGIIVSKVNNEGESDATLRANLQQELVQSLLDNKILSSNETLVFREILVNNQLEIFSNPRREVPILDYTQRKQMLGMLNTRMDYINKADAKIRIDRTHTTFECLHCEQLRTV
jgi:hypothetical protein